MAVVQYLTDINWRGYRRTAWAGLVLLGVTVILASIRGDAGNAIIFIIFLALTAGVVTLHRRFPAFFSLIVVTAGLLSAAGWAWNWYGRVLPYDEIAHAVSTLALTLVAAFYLYRPLTQFFNEHLWLLAVTLVCVGLAIGALWEIIEYFFVVGVVVEGKMELFDLVLDLIMDLTGALVAVPISIWAVKQAQREGVA